MTTQQAMDVARRRWSGTYSSHKVYTAAIRAILREAGETCVPAEYDSGENCLICGESGRCPGVHTLAEKQRAEAWYAANGPQLQLALEAPAHV